MFAKTCIGGGSLLCQHYKCCCFHSTAVPGVWVNIAGTAEMKRHGMGYPIFRQSHVIQPGVDGTSYYRADGVGEKLQIFDLLIS
jgi:hypothetical protein